MQSILTNTAIASTGRVINISLGIVVTALITRYLGPANFGVYAVLISFCTILQLLADFGLYLTLTKEISSRPQFASALISNTVGLRLVLLIVTFSFGFLVSRLIPSISNLPGAFIVLALGFSMQSISQLFMGIFQRLQVVWRATIGDLAGRSAHIAVILFIGASNASLTNIAAAFAISTVIALLIHQWLLPGIKWRPSFNKDQWRYLLLNSWPLGLMLLLNAVYFRLDVLILSFFRSAEEVGLYSLAYRIIESSLFFPAMLGGLLLPRLSECLKNKRRALARQYLSAGSKLVYVVGLLIVIILLMDSKKIVILISGSSFVSAAPLLQLLSWALLIMFLGNIFGFALVSLQRQMFLLKLYASLVIFNAAANLVFIPAWGSIAAAWTTVLTEAIAAASAGFLVMRSLSLKPNLAYIIKTALNGLAVYLFILTFLSFQPLLLRLIITILAYIALGVVTGTLTKQHLASLLTKRPPRYINT